MVRSLFSTAGLHPRDRFAFWHDVACKSVVDHDATPECRQAFEAQLESGTLADIGLVLFENSPMTVSHTARHTTLVNDDELFVCRQMAGKLLLEQDGREALLEAGHMALLDPRLPYSGRFYSGSKLLVVKVPRRQLEGRLGMARSMLARALIPAAPVQRLTSDFLASVSYHADGMHAAARDIVKNQVLDLIAVSFGSALDERPGLSFARSLAAMKIRAVIEARLMDPALDVKTIAAMAGVSVRYANAVLAANNTSVGRLILARRLERCRQSLGDIAQAHRTVSDIAYGWSFSDMTHFGRRFKEAYGLLPSDYRKSIREGGATSAIPGASSDVPAN